MIPCNACDINKCGSCVADKLVRQGHIRRAGVHCGCAENGHKNDQKVTDRPNVKGMFSKQKEETESVEKEIAVENE